MTTSDDLYPLCDVCGKDAGWNADGVLLCWQCVKSSGADLPRTQRRAAGYHGARADRLPLNPRSPSVPVPIPGAEVASPAVTPDTGAAGDASQTPS